MNAGPCAGFLFRLGLRRRSGERECERAVESERKTPAREKERERECVGEEEHGLGSAMWDI